MKQDLNNIILSYFAGFGKNDISQITRDFDKNVTLTDWEVDCTGIEEVRSAIEKILSNGKISIYPENIFYSKSGEYTFATCLITIEVKGAIGAPVVVKVVDVITMRWGRIQSIKAYKQ